eukprot:6873662-Pyramimonas_sp.AAC.1
MAWAALRTISHIGMMPEHNLSAGGKTDAPLHCVFNVFSMCFQCVSHGTLRGADLRGTDDVRQGSAVRTLIIVPGSAL